MGITPMDARRSLIDDFEDALQSDSPERRNAMLHQISDLFVRTANSLGEDQITLFDQLLTRLIDVVEAKALVELSRQLAPVATAPAEVVRRLARNDEIQIAGPVLACSERLETQDLLEIARTKSQAHLLAISSRRNLDESVTDVLLDRGRDEVIRKLAGNLGARFSEDGFAALVARAEKDANVAEAIIRRSDIPKYLYNELVTQATEAVRQKLTAGAGSEAASQVRETMTKVSGELAANSPKPADYEKVLQQIRLEHPAGKLGQQDVMTYASTGRFEETVASLSIICSARVDLVDRLMHGRRVEPVLFLCKASSFEWRVVRAVLRLRLGGRSAEDLQQASAAYDKLTPASAKQALRFWEDRVASAVRRTG
jgi:uncharacterized protein (DUF2336 family)